MHVEDVGPPSFRRWRVVHQGRVWSGERWVDGSQPGLLFADPQQAKAEWDRLKEGVWARDRVCVYRVPFEFGVRSGFAFDVEEARKVIRNEVRIRPPQDIALPQHAVVTHWWFLWQEMQRGPLDAGKPPRFEDDQPKHLDFVVPLRIGVFGTPRHDLESIRQAIRGAVTVTSNDCLVADPAIIHLELDWLKLHEEQE